MRLQRLLAYGCIVSLSAARHGAGNELQEVWVSQYDSPVPASAPGRRVVTDGLGNIIVAAEVLGGNGRLFLEIVKYDSRGELLWTRELRDTVLWPVGQVFLAVDGEGNIHAAASHIPPDASDNNAADIRTFLLDPDGQLLWQADFGEPDSFDSTNALIVDAAGGTIVAGSDGGRGWVTIRHDRTGSATWTARHAARLDRFYSSVSAIVAGDSGEVYVAGQLDFELVIVRYDALGKIVWEAKAGEGIAGAIGRDQNGDVYVSGTLQEDNQSHFAILKYDARGNELWRRILPKFGGETISLAITVPPTGGAYAAAVHLDTGLSSEDILLILAVDPDGNKLWEASEPSGCAVAVAHDSNGNLLVLGWKQGSGIDFTAAKYAPDGRNLWSASHDGPGADRQEIDDFPHGLALDKDGDVVVVGFVTNLDRQRQGVALKYGSDGQLSWLVQIPGVGGLVDVVRALAIDNAGNSYVVGLGLSDSTRNIVIVQNLPDGKRGWVSGLATPGVFRDPTAARLDPAGNLLVCGSTTSSAPPSTAFLLFKLDRHGSLVWQTTHGESSQGDSYSNDLAVDDAGNAYITGAANTTENGKDWATVKIDASGSIVWAAGEHGGDDDEAVAVAVNSDGGIYVTGRTGMRDASSAYRTAKYDAEGRKLWASDFKQSQFSEATALALGPDGGVYVTGTIDRPSLGQPEYATIRYDREGRELWVIRSGAPQSNCCSAPALVVNAAGNAFVTGKGGLTQKYSEDGQLLWAALQPNLDGRAIALDPAGDVFVAGTLDTLENRTDFFLIQYDVDGSIVATASREAPPSTFYQLEAMAIDRAGDILLAGSTGGLFGPSDFLTLKLRNEDAPFQRGDANQDGQFDIADGITIIGALFRGTAQPPCEQSADINADGTVGLSDAISCFSYQLMGGEAPAPPFPDCGEEDAPSGLRCTSFSCP